MQQSGTWTATRLVATIIGKLAAWLFGIAERIDENWDLEWLRIRDAVRRRYAELDEGWNECNLPTMPCPPPVPMDDDDGDHITNRRIEIRPPAMPKSERRVIIEADGRKLGSVTPPPGSWWGKGGGSA